MSVNKVILIGNLGKDPVVTRFEDGKAIANFTLATNERWKDKDGVQQTLTEWHNITMRSPLAEIAEKYLRKGNQVYLEGKIRTREYTDKRDNSTKRITEIVVENMTMLGGGSGASSSDTKDYGSSSVNYGTSAAATSSYASDPSGSADDDDLPF